MNNCYQLISVEHNESIRKVPFQVAAKVCGVTVETIGKWSTNQQTPHPSAIALLKMYAFGLLPLFDVTAWNGYSFKQQGYGQYSDRPVLVTPYDEEITAQDIDAIPYQRQYTEALERQNTQLKKEIKELKQHRPGCEVIAFGPHLRRKEYGFRPRSA